MADLWDHDSTNNLNLTTPELQVELIICPNGSKYLIKMHCEHRFGPRVSSQYLDS